MDTHQETPDANPDTVEASESTEPSTAPESTPEAPAPPTDATEPAAAQAEIDVEEVEDFGAALEQWEARTKSVKEGQVVTGRVLKVLEKEVIVDVGYKSEGVIDIEEFRGVDRKINIHAGDEVDVLLEKTEDADGYVVLSKEKAERLKVWDRVEKAYETNEPVMGRIVDRIKGGLKVDIGLPAFLPGSLVDVCA